MLFLFVLHWSSSVLHNIYYMWSGLSPFLFELPGSTPALNTTCRLSTMVAQSTAPLKPHTHRTAGRGLALFRNLCIEGSLSSVIREHDKLCPKPPMGDKKIKPGATLTRYTPPTPAPITKTCWYCTYGNFENACLNHWNDRIHISKNIPATQT